MKKVLFIITIAIAFFAIIAGVTGIFYEGKGLFNAFENNYDYTSIRGNTVNIYAKGLYHHMSAEVAIQGIAQDYITVFIAIPLLLIFMCMYRKKPMIALFLLSGTLLYFLVTYLFYTAMGMYSFMFLVHVILLSLSFFAFTIALILLFRTIPEYHFSKDTPTKFVGWFLMLNAFSIAVLWLEIIISPFFKGEIYPVNLEHYTTLIVQGFDLALLLPTAFVSGFLLVKNNYYGYIFSTVYVIFLSFMMTSLVAKIIAMAINNVNVIPVIFIIPTFSIVAILCSCFMLKNLKHTKTSLSTKS